MNIFKVFVRFRQFFAAQCSDLSGPIYNKLCWCSSLKCSFWYHKRKLLFTNNLKGCSALGWGWGVCFSIRYSDCLKRFWVHFNIAFCSKIISLETFEIDILYITFLISWFTHLNSYAYFNCNWHIITKLEI